jgi:hypothetical protein
VRLEGLRGAEASGDHGREPAPSSSASAEPAEAAAVVVAARGHLEPHDSLPVVARMVVEIRSDGSRTVATGRVDDLASGQVVAVRVEGASPLSLAGQLAGALWQLPPLGRLLPGAWRRWPLRRRGPAPLEEPLGDGLRPRAGGRSLPGDRDE